MDYAKEIIGDINWMLPLSYELRQVFDLELNSSIF